jgi:hypothetical protein
LASAWRWADGFTLALHLGLYRRAGFGDELIELGKLRIMQNGNVSFS